jgi:hypothetical protein
VKDVRNRANLGRRRSRGRCGDGREGGEGEREKRGGETHGASEGCGLGAARAARPEIIGDGAGTGGPGAGGRGRPGDRETELHRHVSPAGGRVRCGTSRGRLLRAPDPLPSSLRPGGALARTPRFARHTRARASSPPGPRELERVPVRARGRLAGRPAPPAAGELQRSAGSRLRRPRQNGARQKGG